MSNKAMERATAGRWQGGSIKERCPKRTYVCSHRDLLLLLLLLPPLQLLL
jgi:hypothetical protein